MQSLPSLHALGSTSSTPLTTMVVHEALVAEITRVPPTGDEGAMVATLSRYSEDEAEALARVIVEAHMATTAIDDNYARIVLEELRSRAGSLG